MGDSVYYGESELIGDSDFEDSESGRDADFFAGDSKNGSLSDFLVVESAIAGDSKFYGDSEFLLGDLDFF